MFAFLKQSTASQSRLVGPFLDDTDFKTPETALTIANTDVKLSANGAASANKNSGGGTHRTNGMYGLTFDATDTATVGELAFAILVSGALLVVGKFWVLEEAIYDAIFGASAAGYGTAQTGDNYARLGAPVGASISADVAAAAARLPTALTGAGNIKADAVAIDGDTSAATRLKRGALASALVTVGSGSTTTSVVTSSIDPAASVADQFKDRSLVFDKATTTAALRGQGCRITASTSGGVLTVTALTTAPANTDTAEIV